MTLLNLLLISVVLQASNSCEEVCFDHWRLNFLERSLAEYGTAFCVELHALFETRNSPHPE